MENVEEKIEAIDQVIENLIPKIQALETAVSAQPKIEIPDFGKQLDHLIKLTQLSNKNINDNLIHFKESTDVLIEIIQAIPKPTPAKHYHHFDLKSKVFVTGFIVAFLTVAIAVGLAVSFGIASNRRYHDSKSYQIVRAFYPHIAKSVDDAYRNNAEALTSEAETRLNEQKTLSAKAYDSLIEKRDKSQSKNSKKKK